MSGDEMGDDHRNNPKEKWNGLIWLNAEICTHFVCSHCSTLELSSGTGVDPPLGRKAIRCLDNRQADRSARHRIPNSNTYARA
jgi:hypothetical protein